MKKNIYPLLTCIKFDRAWKGSKGREPGRKMGGERGEGKQGGKNSVPRVAGTETVRGKIATFSCVIKWKPNNQNLQGEKKKIQKLRIKLVRK